LATKRFWKRKKLPSVSSDFFVYSHCAGNGSSPSRSLELHTISTLCHRIFGSCHSIA
jgi:hypothetical protein